MIKGAKWGDFVLCVLAFLATAVAGLGNDAGLLDAMWGTGGMVMTTNRTEAVAETADGGMFVLGSLPDSNQRRKVTLTKLTSAGVPDTMFTPTGTAVLPFGTESLPLVPRALAVQEDGGVLVLCESTYTSRLVVYRVTSTGGLDPVFASGTKPFLCYSLGEYPAAVAIQALPGGGFVMLGGYQRGLPRLYQCKADGTLDPSFGSGGQVSVPANVNSTSLTPVSLEARADGGYRVLSSYKDVYSYPALVVNEVSAAGVAAPMVKLPAAGVSLPPEMRGSFVAAHSDAAGHVLAAGATPANKLLMVRFLVNGDLDPAFAEDGVLVSDLGLPDKLVLPADVWQRPADGRVFVGGRLTQSGNGVQSVFMACFRPDGTPETTFGTGGVTVTSLPGVTLLAPAGMKPQADGGLCLFGSTTYEADTGFLARYRPATVAAGWEPPVITAQPPAHTTLNLGAAVTFTVKLKPGNALNPGIVWMLGGKVAGRGAVLSIPVTKLEDEGFYSVIASNYAGSAQVNLDLKLRAPPVVLYPPVAHAGPHGKDYEFKVIVAGRTPLTYEWRRNGAEVYTQVLNATTCSYYVPVEKADEGLYTVKITNADGTVTTAPVALKALAAPPVVVTPAQPVYMNASATDAASLTLQLDGTGPFTCQWQKNGKNYGALVDLEDVTAILAIAALAENSGDYRCIIKGAEGTLTTPAVPVRFYDHQPAVRLPEAVVISLWYYLEPDVQVFGWDGPVTFQWQRNGVNIPGATSVNLDMSVQTTAAQAAGTYRVIMTAGGKAYVSNNCSVAAVEGAYTRYVDAAQGATVTASVKAAGPGLRYEWHCTNGNGTEIVMDPRRFTGLQSPTLKITHVDEETDLGYYSCTVTRPGAAEGFDFASSGTFRLAIQKAKPVLPAFTLAAGTVAVNYSQAVPVAANAASAYTVKGLPPGLFYYAPIQKVIGTPTTPGTWNVTFTATNTFGSVTSKAVKLVVAPLPASVAGTWSGPVLDGGGSPSGCSGSLAIAANGTYTLKLNGLMGGTSEAGLFAMGPYASVSLVGRLTGYNGDGNTLEETQSLLLPGVAAPVTVYIGWSLSEGATVYIEDYYYYFMELHHNTWSARANPATAYAAPYTVELAFPAAAAGDPARPAGRGYATFTPRSDGTLTFAGKLPDGTAFTIPAFLDPDGTVWLQSWLYGGNGGVLEDKINLSIGSAPGNLDSNVTGSLHFRRPGLSWTPVEAVDNPWLADVDVTLAVKGARHLPPGRSLLGSGALMMNAGAVLPNISVSVSGGMLSGMTVLDASLKTSQAASFPAFLPGAEVKFTSLAFAPATGLFSGAFTYYVYDGVSARVKSSLAIPVQGVVVRDNSALPAGRATGFFAISQTLGLHDKANPAKLVKVAVPVSGEVKVETVK